MKKATRAWVRKAEGDLTSAEALLSKRVRGVNDSICYHAQQCVEKYMKALLQEREVRFERTHNLLSLLDQVLPFLPEWELLRPDLRELTEYAVAFRYPGRSADRRLAKRAVRQCQAMRDTVRLQLRLRGKRRSSITTSETRKRRSAKASSRRRRSS
jgi:HEPN domain-containing protein